MAYNIRVNKLLKGLNVSLEDFRFFMSNEEINATSRVRVVTNGERTYNPKLMTTVELVEMRESLLRDIEEKEISKLHKQLEVARDEVRKIEESIIEIEVRHLEDESDFEASEDWEQMTYDEERGPWSPNWFKVERTAEEALEDLKRKMEAKDDDNQDLSGTFPLTRL